LALSPGALAVTKVCGSCDLSASFYYSSGFYSAVGGASGAVSGSGASGLLASFCASSNALLWASRAFCSSFSSLTLV